MLATLLCNVPSGLAHNENYELISTEPFVGKTGIVIEEHNELYTTDSPTRYTPCYYLVNFGTEKLWLPRELYFYYDREKDIWKQYLKIKENQCLLSY